MLIESTLMTARRDTRKEELANKFFGLIMPFLRRIRMWLAFMRINCVAWDLTMVISRQGKSQKTD